MADRPRCTRPGRRGVGGDPRHRQRLNARLPFADYFRDFSVWNSNRTSTSSVLGTGLESDSWQSRISDFPRIAYDRPRTRSVSAPSRWCHGQVLAAQDDRFVIDDPRYVRSRSTWAHCRTRARPISTSSGNSGRRHPTPIRAGGVGSRRTLPRTRSVATSRTRTSRSSTSWSQTTHEPVRKAGLDPAAAVTGFYNVKAQDHCDIPIGYKGTFKMKERSSVGPSLIDFDAEGHIKYTYAFTAAACDAPFLRRRPTASSTAISWTARRRPGRPRRSPSAAASTRRVPPSSRIQRPGTARGDHDHRRHPEASFANIYHLFFGSSTKTMLVDLIDLEPDGADRVQSDHDPAALLFRRHRRPRRHSRSALRRLAAPGLLHGRDRPEHPHHGHLLVGSDTDLRALSGQATVQNLNNDLNNSRIAFSVQPNGFGRSSSYQTIPAMTAETSESVGTRNV